jgi:hypothetical protein
MISYGMAKPRDYQAENARRHIGRAVAIGKEMFGPNAPSFYRVSLHGPIRQAIADDRKCDALLGELTSAQVRHLSEIARLDHGLARQLAEQPEAITPTYQKYRATIASLKKRRVNVQDRIERAWPGLWSRWSEKFAPEDLPAMRQQCARRIMAEMEDDEFKDFIDSFFEES